MMGADVGLIVAIVGVGIAMVGVVISMMFWARTESNAIRQEQKEDRRELLQISRNLEMTVVSINAEMRDFHQQLLALQRDKSNS